jgi:hypothetical protein
MWNYWYQSSTNVVMPWVRHSIIYSTQPAKVPNVTENFVYCTFYLDQCSIQLGPLHAFSMWSNEGLDQKQKFIILDFWSWSSECIIWELTIHMNYPVYAVCVCLGKTIRLTINIEAMKKLWIYIEEYYILMWIFVTWYCWRMA